MLLTILWHSADIQSCDKQDARRRWRAKFDNLIAAAVIEVEAVFLTALRSLWAAVLVERSTADSCLKLGPRVAKLARLSGDG